jgi:hypothetical protein
MGRIIFWLVIAFGALLALRLVNTAKARSPNGAATGAGSRRGGGGGAMVRCVGCGVFVPGADAVATPRGPTCGDARCLRLGRSDAA